MLNSKKEPTRTSSPYANQSSGICHHQMSLTPSFTIHSLYEYGIIFLTVKGFLVTQVCSKTGNFWCLLNKKKLKIQNFLIYCYNIHQNTLYIHLRESSISIWERHYFAMDNISRACGVLVLLPWNLTPPPEIFGLPVQMLC